MITPVVPPELVDLKQQFDQIDAAAVERFCESNTPEDLQLEFKTVKGASFKSEDDKRNFSKALSGFANASGGIVVWGVTTGSGKTEDDPDYASEVVPIDNVNALVAALNQHTARAIYPRTVYVHNEAVLMKGERDKGFAKTLVGLRELDPIRAVNAGGRYYRRIGDSFMQVEHDELRDMFGIRRPPVLRTFLSSIKALPNDGYRSVIVALAISLENAGRFTALAPFVSYTMPLHCGWDQSHLAPLNRIRTAIDKRVVSLGSDASTVLHPGREIVLGSIQLTVQTAYNKAAGSSRGVTIVRSTTLQNLSDLAVPYQISSYDLPVQAGEIELKADDMRSSVENVLDNAPNWIQVIS